MIYQAGNLYRLKRDYVTGPFRIQAGGNLFCVLIGERTIYMRAQLATTDGSFQPVDVTVPISLAHDIIEPTEKPEVIPMDPDPLTWYGKRIEVIRDIPTLTGSVLLRGTPGLEVLGSEGKDLLIGWRVSYKTEATGEWVGDEPILEQVIDENPAAIARVPISLFWILPVQAAEKIENSPVGEEQ